jgi:hypothetical protein
MSFCRRLPRLSVPKLFQLICILLLTIIELSNSVIRLVTCICGQISLCCRIQCSAIHKIRFVQSPASSNPILNRAAICLTAEEVFIMQEEVHRIVIGVILFANSVEQAVFELCGVCSYQSKGLLRHCEVVTSCYESKALRGREGI